jgi:hypothetical protein
MKYRQQIYVIGFRFNYKMKEIVILLVTFLGICKGFAQSSDGSFTPDSTKNSLQKIAADSLPPKEKANFRLFPNPAKNKAELEVKGFKPGTIQLEIVDVNGKLLRDDQRLLVNGNEHMVMMFSLQPGIYFIVLKQKERSMKKKMVVQ